MVGQASFESRGNAKGGMHAAKVVVSKVQGYGGLEVVQFLRIGIGKPGQAADRHTHSKVLRFDVTGRNMPHIRPAIPDSYYGFYHRRRRVTSCRIMLAVVTIQLYQLCKVCLSGKNLLNSTSVELKTIRRDLETMIGCHPVPKYSQELVRIVVIALSNDVGRNQFCIRINCDERPSVSEFFGLSLAYVALLLAAKTPQLIGLYALAVQILHSRIHQLYAAFTSKNQQPNDRVPVQLRDSFCAPNARAFNQKLNRQQSFILGNNHVAKQPGVFFGVGLAACSATKTAKAIPVFAELPTFNLALRAIHESTLQQAVAVCQEERVPKL